MEEHTKTKGLSCIGKGAVRTVSCIIHAALKIVAEGGLMKHCEYRGAQKIGAYFIRWARLEVGFHSKWRRLRCPIKNVNPFQMTPKHGVLVEVYGK